MKHCNHQARCFLPQVDVKYQVKDLNIFLALKFWYKVIIFSFTYFRSILINWRYIVILYTYNSLFIECFSHSSMRSMTLLVSYPQGGTFLAHNGHIVNISWMSEWQTIKMSWILKGSSKITINNFDYLYKVVQLSLSWGSKEIHVPVLICMYTHIYKYF